MSNTLESTSTLFPELPEHEGVAYAIYLEPVNQSGERICIGALSIIDGLGFSLSRAFPPNHHPNLARLDTTIDHILASIENQWWVSGSLSGYQPCIQGVTITKSIVGKFSSTKMAINTSLRNSSMFWVDDGGLA